MRFTFSFNERGSPWSLSVMNICSSIRKHYAPFSDTGCVHNMFTIDRNKSLVNFTGSNFLRLQKPNHASDLTVGGVWYQRVHCLNLSHSQRGKVCCTNCTRQLSTLYWTHHMTHQLKWNNCAGCMRKSSLLSRWITYLCISRPHFQHLARTYWSGRVWRPRYEVFEKVRPRRVIGTKRRESKGWSNEMLSLRCYQSVIF